MVSVAGGGVSGGGGGAGGDGEGRVEDSGEQVRVGDCRGVGGDGEGLRGGDGRECAWEDSTVEVKGGMILTRNRDAKKRVAFCSSSLRVCISILPT